MTNLGGFMRSRMPLTALFLALAAVPAEAQKPTAAVYITDEDVKVVNAQPGTDRQIRVVDIGNEHFAVGIVHRGASVPAAARGAAAPAGSGRGGAAATTPARVPCGDEMATLPADATPGGIYHDSQTEGYYIVSGGGTLVTGGRIVNGNKSGPESAVTKELNGPSCSGAIEGNIVRRVVKTGDIIIIPTGVGHGWSQITDHVTYLSVRPDPDRVLPAGYVYPLLLKNQPTPAK